MSTPIAMRLYLALADDTQLTLPADLQRRIWAAATAAGDEQLMVTLIERCDAPADLLPKFAAATSAKARIAYLGRPDLDSSEIAAVLAREKRVTVLASLASADATNEMVFDELAEQMVARGSRQLATALLRAEHVTSRALLRTLAYIDTTVATFGWQLAKDVDEAVLRLGPEEAEVAVDTLGTRIYRNLVGREGLSVHTRLRLVEQLVGPACFGVVAQQWLSPSPVSMFTALMGCADLQLEVMAALDEVLAQSPPSLGGDLVEEYRLRLVHASGGLVSMNLSPSERAQRINDLKVAADPDSDPAALAAFCEVALDQADAAMAAHLAANRATPALAAASVVGLLDTETTVVAAYRAQLGVPDRDPVRLALLAAHPKLLAGRLIGPSQGTVIDADLAHFDDPSAAAESLCALYADQLARASREGTRAHGSVLQALLRLVDSPLAAASDAAGALPWRYVCDDSVSSRRSQVSADARIVARLLELQREHLGDNEAAWSVFEQLAGQFTGSMAELFTAVAAVAAPAALPGPGKPALASAGR